MTDSQYCGTVQFWKNFIKYLYCLFLIKSVIFETDAKCSPLWICSLFNKARTLKTDLLQFKPIQDGPFWGCSRMEEGKRGPLPYKICHTYPTMMKLGTTLLKEDPKIMNVKHLLSSAGISIFSLEISNFCCIRKYKYKLHFDA